MAIESELFSLVLLVVFALFLHLVLSSTGSQRDRKSHRS